MGVKYFLGLDISLSSTGVSIIDGDYNYIAKDKIEGTGMFGAERLRILHDNLERFIIENIDPSLIKLACIEGPSYNSNVGNLFEIGEVTGCYKYLISKNNIPYIIATPQQLKKYVLGKALAGKDGGSKKELVILDVYKKFGEEIRDNNIADSYVLSRIAHDFYNLDTMGDELFPYQKEVLTALLKSKRKDNQGVVLS